MKKIIAGILLAAGFDLAAQAAGDSWKTDAAGAWTNTASWADGNVPGIAGGTNSADVATFSVTLTTNRVITVDTNRNIGGITFQNAANFSGTNAANSVGYTLSGGTLRLSNGGVIQVLETAAGTGSNNSTIASAVVIQGDGGSAMFKNDSASGASGLRIDGNVTGNSTAGNTTTLYLDGTSTAAGNGGSSRNNMVNFLGNGSAGGNLAVVKNGEGLWTLYAASTFTGGFIFNEGTIRYFGKNSIFGAGSLTIGDGVTFNHANTNQITFQNPLVVNGNFTINGANNTAFSGPADLGAFTRTITVNTSTQTVFSGVISGSGGLTKAGTAPLTLSGANNYSGNTTISAGTLIANADRALGGTANITVAQAAILTLTNGVLNNYINDVATLKLATNSTLNLNFTGTDAIGFLSLDGGVTWLSNGTYNADALIAAGGRGVYTGVGSLSVSSEPVPPPRSGLVFIIENYIEPLEVYVCAGQSNMAGKGKKAELPAELQAPQTNVFVFNGTDWVVMEPAATEGIGPEYSFAYEMQKALNKPIGIIQHDKGGTNLAEDWNPALPANLYVTLKDKVTAAQQSRKISVKGMIWMQGERDSNFADMAAAYGQNLTNLIQAARTDFNGLGMPFVAARVNPPYVYANLVRAAQETCAAMPYAWVNCDDLPKVDTLHYNTAGQVELGKRFAQSVLDLQ